MSCPVYAPCFPEGVILIEINEEQLKNNVGIVRAVFQNMCGILSTNNVGSLVQDAKPPKNVRLDVLSFHWDEYFGCGYYVPFDVIPVIKFLHTIRNLTYEKHGMVFLHALRVAAERRYMYLLGTFAGPFAFTVQYNPPVHVCVPGRVTPTRVAVNNLYQTSDAKPATNALFAEFGEAVRRHLYKDLQWSGVLFSVGNFMRLACVAPSKPDAPREDPVTPRTDGNPLIIDPAVYCAMQYSTVMGMQDALGDPHGTVSLRVHFPDTGTADVHVEGVRVDSFHDLENYMRVVSCRDRFWAEVLVLDSNGAKMNHVTFESAMRAPDAAFDVYMHRFIDIPALVSVSAAGNIAEFTVTHRTFESLEAQARAMAAVRFGLPALMDRSRYLFEAGDTLADGGGVALTRRSYGEYTRGHDAVIKAVFYSPAVDAQQRIEVD